MSLESELAAANKQLESSIVTAVKKFEETTGVTIKAIKLVRLKVSKGNGTDFLAGASFEVIC